MLKARPQHADKLDFVQVGDFTSGADFAAAVKGVDAIIHVASVSILGRYPETKQKAHMQQPLSYDTKDNEKELIIPAINGVKAIMSAAASEPSVKRVVLTSSFASVMNADRKAPPYFTYTGDDWNPLTYAESIAPDTPAFIAYRGSKLFAEKAAWDFVAENKPGFSLVTLCPPMTFGPIVHPISKVEELNESNSMLWKIATGAKPLPVARVPFWIDVRDLALAHAEAALKEELGGRRYVPAATERFSYGKAASIMDETFDWARGKVTVEDQPIDESHGLDGQTAAKDLGLQYKTFRQTVVDLVGQAYEMKSKAAEA